MTAKGILYIEEDCRDAFKKELNKRFGKEKWYLDGSKLCNLWNLADMPIRIEVPVMANDTNEHKVLGNVLITSKLTIQEEYGGRYIEPTPDSITILRKVKPKKIRRIKK